MHHLLPLKVKIWVIVVLAALIAGAANWFGFDRLGLSAVVGMVECLVIYVLFRSWTFLTRVSMIPRPAWMRTDLSGEWIGEIQSQWKTVPDAATSDPIPTSLDLRQEWGEVVFSFKTDKMRARSTGAVPSYDPVTRELRFRYFYETEPTAASNDANPPQQLGSALACVQLDKPDRMRIRYTNERSPGGDIELRRRRKKEAQHVSVA
jgi:hypothetical protein